MKVAEGRSISATKEAAIANADCFREAMIRLANR